MFIAHSPQFQAEPFITTRCDRYCVVPDRPFRDWAHDAKSNEVRGRCLANDQWARLDIHEPIGYGLIWATVKPDTVHEHSLASSDVRGEIGAQPRLRAARRRALAGRAIGRLWLVPRTLVCVVSDVGAGRYAGKQQPKSCSRLGFRVVRVSVLDGGSDPVAVAADERGLRLLLVRVVHRVGSDGDVEFRAAGTEVGCPSGMDRRRGGG